MLNHLLDAICSLFQRKHQYAFIKILQFFKQNFDFPHEAIHPTPSSVYEAK